MRETKVKFRQIISLMMALVLCLGLALPAKTASAEVTEELVTATTETINVTVAETDATVKVYKIVDVYDKIDGADTAKYSVMKWASADLIAAALVVAKEHAYALQAATEFTPHQVLALTPAQQQDFYYALAGKIATSGNALGLSYLQPTAGDDVFKGYTSYTYKTRVEDLDAEPDPITKQDITVGQYMTVTTGKGYIYQPTTINVIPKLNASTQKYEALPTSFSVDIKHSKPSVDKKVDDQYVAVGDTATFTIDIDVPVYGLDYNYENLVFDIVDVMSKAFSYKTGSVKVEGIKNVGKVDETKTTLSTSNYSTEYCDQVYNLGGQLEMVYNSADDRVHSLKSRSDKDLDAYLLSYVPGTYADKPAALEALNQKTGETGLYVKFAYNSIKSYQKLVITYQATITNQAEPGKTTNVNTVYLRYSVDPNKPGEPEIPKDEERVYTFGIDVLKVDAGNTSKKLSGAVFDLYKLLKSDMTLVDYNTLAATQGFVEADYTRTLNADNTTYTVYHKIKKDLTTDVAGKIVVNGLDIGNYQLKETKAPTGYNLLTEPREVTITSTSGTPQRAMEFATGVSSSEGHAGVRVLNAQGITLPSTGGSGTNIYLMLGGMIMCAAMGLAVFKLRK